MNYDTGLLIDIVESIQGIAFVGNANFNGIITKKYIGLGGNLVIVDVTDEDMDEDTAKGLLTSLGLPNLIEALFPKDKQDDNNKTDC